MMPSRPLQHLSASLPLSKSLTAILLRRTKRGSRVNDGGAVPHGIDWECSTASRPSRHNQPEPARHSRELDERRVALDHLETRRAQFLVDDLDRDVVLRDLLLSREPAAAVVHWFDDNEAPIGLQRRTNMPKHRLVLGHLVIRVMDQNRIELIDGKVWIVDAADHALDIFDVLAAGTITQLVEGGLTDVHGNGAAIRRDRACDWNREGAVAGTDVGDQRSRLRPEKADDVGDAVLALELGTGILTEPNQTGAADRDRHEYCCKPAVHGYRLQTSADHCHVWRRATKWKPAPSIMCVIRVTGWTNARNGLSLSRRTPFSTAIAAWTYHASFG